MKQSFDKISIDFEYLSDCQDFEEFGISDSENIKYDCLNKSSFLNENNMSISKQVDTRSPIGMLKKAFNHWTKSGNCFFKARLVASLVGQIISMQAAMGSVVRLRTRSLYECIMQKASWDSPVLIKEMAFDEVVFWKENVEFLNGKELLDEKVCTSVVYTDASGTGFGGYIVEDSTRTNNRRRNIGSWCDVR
ncbi:unnamed protein product [Mytilus edulis]|uniref:Uncharacterized protein n=1 Tax=Mytilus edulis TaxID=6550 RepID=A0A8S3VFW8_MYTED|nr:unnamed protein product [Mytilus edulis]